MASITLRSFRLNAITNAVFTYSDEVWARLSTSCFRRDRQNRPVAGRIFLWDSLASMFKNEAFMSIMAKEIQRILDTMTGRFWNGYFTLKHAELAGWASCASRQNFLPAELHECLLNKHSVCLMASRGSTFLAPLTNELTFAATIERWSLGLEVQIHTLYPGPCFAPRPGDLTEQTGLVLFDREHPGQDLSIQTAE